jgi:hypothetical protein
MIGLSPCPEVLALLQEARIQVVPAWPWRWQHGLPPSVFARKRPVP